MENFTKRERGRKKSGYCTFDLMPVRNHGCLCVSVWHTLNARMDSSKKREEKEEERRERRRRRESDDDDAGFLDGCWRGCEFRKRDGRKRGERYLWREKEEEE